MKVVHISLSLTYGGIETMLVNIANAQAENGAEVHVCIIKPQPYIVEHMADYDFFVQPSRWEGFGLTVAEAMAAKVLVLFSEGQGPAEVTCGYFYGWIFENGNANDLAAKIKYIYDNYDEAMDKANSALNYVHNTYDVSVTAKKNLDLYTMDPNRRGVFYEVIEANHTNHWRAAA